MAPDTDPSRARPVDSTLQDLDMAVMDQLLDLDDGAVGLLKEMCGLFREDTPGRIEALEAALAAGDMVELADVAHAIKGAAGTMGIPRLRSVAAELEGGGRKGAFSAAPALLLEQLRAAYADGMAAIEAFVTLKES